MNALCTAPSRAVRNPTTRGESCGFVDESYGPARALRAVWTARGQRGRVAHRLPTLSRLSPTSSTGPTTGDSQNKHRTTLRRGCLHRPFKTTSASHSNRSQHRPRAGSPPTLQAHFRMGLDSPPSRHREYAPQVLRGQPRDRFALSGLSPAGIPFRWIGAPCTANALRSQRRKAPGHPVAAQQGRIRSAKSNLEPIDMADCLHRQCGPECEPPPRNAEPNRPMRKRLSLMVYTEAFGRH